MLILENQEMKKLCGPFLFFCALWIRQQSVPANYSEGHSIFPGICAGEEVDAIKTNFAHSLNFLS